MNSDNDCGLVNLVHAEQRAWYKLNLGRYVLEDERERLDNILPDLFGYHLLQAGRMADADLLQTSRISHRMIMDSDGDVTNPASALYGRADALPIASDSLDVLVLPHTLEFEPDPHQVLREAQRALIAEGCLVILGFNPWSLWGLWRLARRNSDKPPWCGRFLSLMRIKDWLALLGFDVVETHPYLFRPPLQHEGIMKKLNFMETTGARLWPNLAGGYVIVAKKRVIALTPIRPATRRRNSIRTGVAEPTTGYVKHD